MRAIVTHADFFIFNKPAGISFHSEDGAGFFAQLQAQYPQEILFPVHRLDKVTSGLLLVARNKSAAQEFSHLFETHAVQKTYLALSDRKPSKKQGAVSGDMQKTRDGNWKLLRTRENPAVTQFVSHSIAPGLRLFVLKPHTGRTHQLRVMMKALGSPIVGDTRYGGTPADRAYLHAAALEFVWQGERIAVRQLPDSGDLFTGELFAGLALESYLDQAGSSTTTGI